MTTSEKLSLMDHYVKKMTMMLANEFNLSVESSMQFVLASSCFKDLHEKSFLLEEGILRQAGAINSTLDRPDLSLSRSFMDIRPETTVPGLLYWKFF